MTPQTIIYMDKRGDLFEFTISSGGDIDSASRVIGAYPESQA